MASNRGIRPVMDPHYHYDHTSSYFATDQQAHFEQPNVHLSPMEQDYRANMARRFSSPQMGYYDLITGEYRYRSNNDAHNQSPLLSAYAGETEPPMCENSCKCCQAKVPFNCLTICLITSLMLLLMFSFFKLMLGTKPRPTVNVQLFQDMIWLMAIFTLLFLGIILLKYTCFKNSPSCARCKLLDAMSESGDRTKHGIFCHGEHNQYGDTGEEFV